MKHILITGAGGAIGGALVGAFASRFPDAAFSLVDRSIEAMERFAKAHPKAHLLGFDLTDVDALPRLWQEATALAGPVDVLVNCAGIMEIRNFHATTWELGDKLLKIDLIAPLRLMNLAVTDMSARQSGAIVNFSSMAGRTPIRGCTYYGAAKSGLAMASEIAHVELSRRGVHVVTVYPGPVWSGLEAHARAQVSPGLISKAIPTGKAEVIAEKVVDAVASKRKRVVYPGVYWLGLFFHTIASWVTSTFSPEPTDKDPNEATPWTRSA